MITFHENFHIRICTTAAESPWCNGHFEQHNKVLGLMVTKTITNTNCDVDTAAAWAVSTKNSLTNKNRFSPNQLVFSKNSNKVILCFIKEQTIQQGKDQVQLSVPIVSKYSLSMVRLM